jgi:hypothetical protein
MPKVLFIIVLILISGIALFPQEKSKQNESLIPAEIQAILLEAGTLQPELTIDVYLKVISSGKIESKTKRKQLLEEIFYLSYNSKEKIRRKVIAFSGAVLTFRPTFISYAQENKLDALSLKVRIISEMMKIDRNRAFELFNEISPDLSLKPLSCQDFLMYEISDFYNLVGEVAKNSFTQEQIKQGRRITFLSSFVENITSSAQLSPIAKMLSSIDLTDDEKLNIVGSFNKSIRKISGDDRSFSYEMNFGETNKVVYYFSKKLFFGTALYDEFLKSYKDYLVKNLQGTRCQDNINFEKRNGKTLYGNENVTSSIKIPSYIYDANNYFYKDLPIAIDETKPYKIETTTFPVEYYTSPKASQIYSKLRKLRNWQEKEKTISEIRESLKWQETFSNLLEEIDEWEKADNESEIDLFHQKSLIYRLLLREAPSIALRERIVKKYLKLLNQNEIQKDFVSEWFLEFNDLRKEIGGIKDILQQERLSNIVKNTNNSIIHVYLELEKLLKLEKSNLIRSKSIFYLGVFVPISIFCENK